MIQEPLAVTVRILDKEYRIACASEEQDALIESARLLDQRMREIRQTGRVVGSDRIAVMAALNIAHELLQSRRGSGKVDREANQRLRNLQDRLAEALAAQRQLDARGESV